MELEAEKAGLLAVNDKGYVADELRDKIFRKFRMRNDSRMCFECTNRNPTWISVTYGIYLCLECSGEHRRKGVHISYVRSVEMDKFYPDQIVQMACGGNSKAWNYFKERGLGKTSDSKRPVDWNSKITQTYKAQIERETQQVCEKLGLPARGTLLAAASAKEEEAEAAPEASAAEAAPVAAPAAAKAATQAAAKPAPKPAAAPTSVIRRAAPPPQKAAPAAATAPTAAAAAATPAQPARFASSKQMAKEIEFDFDFDELEKEAAKPAPVAPAPAPEPAPVPTPAPAPTPSFASTKPAAAAPPAQAKLGEQTSKYSKSKAISSDDFFGGLDETAEQRMEKEMRYNKFSASGAISSDAFFGDAEDTSPGGSGDGDGWKKKGLDSAKAGISAGKDMLITYLNKVRD
mmetsp:Transcript_139747/g.243367  ORF Transcript_139747/g.243367 Transcript_139747/m.243367 type:complete len:403 (-) Transcript_139747:127-1335(-)